MNHEAEVDASESEAPADRGISAAGEGVARAGAAFSASLHDASLAGRETAERVVSLVRPVMIGIGILAGTVVIIRLLQQASSRTREFHGPTARGRTIWAEAARSLVVSIAAVTGRRLAEHWLGGVQPTRRSASRTTER